MRWRFILMWPWGLHGAVTTTGLVRTKVLSPFLLPAPLRWERSAIFFTRNIALSASHSLFLCGGEKSEKRNQVVSSLVPQGTMGTEGISGI